jgi:hypothetical protein
VTDALGCLSEGPGETYEGEGGQREEEQDRCMHKLSGDGRHGENYYYAVGDVAEQRILLVRISTAGIL